jgi:hypothetical protein
LTILAKVALEVDSNDTSVAIGFKSMISFVNGLQVPRRAYAISSGPVKLNVELVMAEDIQSSAGHPGVFFKTLICPTELGSYTAYLQHGQIARFALWAGCI